MLKNKGKISLLSICLILVLFLVIVYAVSVRIIFSNRTLQTVERTSKIISAQIDSIIRESRNNIQLTSILTSKQMAEKELKNEKEVLQPLADNSPFTFIEYIRWDGINKMNGISNGYEFDASDREYYKQGIQGNSGIWINYSPKVTKGVLINFYTPLYYKNEISGVLTGAINADSITEILEADYFDNGILRIVLDENLQVITSSQNDLMPIPQGMSIKNYQKYDFTQKIRTAIDQKDESVFRFSHLGKKHNACVSKLTEYDWYIVQILPSSIFSRSLKHLTNLTLLIITLLAVFFIGLILFLIIHNRKNLKDSEKEYDNIVSSLATAYDDLFVVDMTTGNIRPYKASSHIEKRFKGLFLKEFNYDLCFSTYAEHEIVEADKHFLDEVSSIEKVRALMKDKKEYSFVYRVLRNNEIHTFNCQFIKPTPDSKQFIQAYKNIDEVVWSSNDREEMQNIQEVLSSGRWDMDFNEDESVSKITFSTPFKKMLGYSENDDFPATIKSIKTLISEDDLEYINKAFVNVIKDSTGKKNLDITIKVRTKKQGIKWFRAAGRLSRRNDGSPKHFIGLLLDVDAHTRLFNDLSALAKVYLTMHTIDLETNTCTQTKSTKEVSKFVNKPTDASQQMKSVMNYICDDEFKEKVLEFTDLSTLPERMKGKQSISFEFISKVDGWVRASFVTATVDSEEKPKTVLFTTRIIEKEKQKEMDLIDFAHRDELTGLFNRRAYEETIELLNNEGLKNDFVYLSFDVNGLKLANDNLGHGAGDELLKGASSCMQEVFGQYGNIFRTGGDEFVAMINLPEDKIQDVCNEFKIKTGKWKGKSIKKLSVSLGYASAAKLKAARIEQLSKFSDQRMYDDKVSYYTDRGIDRRSGKEFYNKLFE